MRETEIPKKLYPNYRNYKIFSFLFGVRSDNDETGLFSFRDWPKDNSYMEFYEDWSEVDFYNQPNNHSYTYMTYDEAEKIEWPEDLKDSYFRIFCDYIWPKYLDVYFDKDAKEYIETEMRMLVSFNS